MAKRDDSTLDLFGPFGTPEAPSNPIEARFWTFHAENPHVYAMFDRFTGEVIRSGRQCFGVAPIIERMRWFTSIETQGDEFKINNDFRAYYARLWMRNHPQHPGIFRTRKLQAGQVSPALRCAAE